MKTLTITTATVVAASALAESITASVEATVVPAFQAAVTELASLTEVANLASKKNVTAEKYAQKELGWAVFSTLDGEALDEGKSGDKHTSNIKRNALTSDIIVKINEVLSSIDENSDAVKAEKLGKRTLEEVVFKYLRSALKKNEIEKWMKL